MLVRKGTVIKTKGATWYVKKTQNVDKYIKAESKDGFETLIDIRTATLYRG